MSYKSGYAIENIRRICDHYLPDNYVLEIVDIGREKQKAVEHQIIAIPTLIRLYPDPRRTLLGDLSDTQKVLKILEIDT